MRTRRRATRYWRYSATSLWLTLPPLSLSLALWSRLPAAYSPQLYWLDIPTWLGAPERFLRVLVFVLAALFPIGCTRGHQRWGWVVYCVGILVYAGSYLALILWPNSTWSSSAVGFAAPAWTTILWFVGIGGIAGPAFVPGVKRQHYLLVVALFVVFHSIHALSVHERLYSGGGRASVVRFQNNSALSEREAAGWAAARIDPGESPRTGGVSQLESLSRRALWTSALSGRPRSVRQPLSTVPREATADARLAAEVPRCLEGPGV